MLNQKVYLRNSAQMINDDVCWTYREKDWSIFGPGNIRKFLKPNVQDKPPLYEVFYSSFHKIVGWQDTMSATSIYTVTPFTPRPFSWGIWTRYQRSMKCFGGITLTCGGCFLQIRFCVLTSLVPQGKVPTSLSGHCAHTHFNDFLSARGAPAYSVTLFNVLPYSALWSGSTEDAGRSAGMWSVIGKLVNIFQSFSSAQTSIITS